MLPPEFLREIAEKYQLTEKEQAVLFAKFSTDKSNIAIANDLHISPSAFSTRLTNIYKKFSISGSGPVKYGLLLNFLTKEYRKIFLHTDTPQDDLDIQALVQEVRQKVKASIEEQYGKMRVLDMNKPIRLNDIYTNVNILEKITGSKRSSIHKLLDNFDPESGDFYRYGLGRITDKRVPGLDAVNKYSKLVVLGKPGAGKTTFLKYLAIQCSKSNFLAEKVPVFITLKQFIETKNQPDLSAYINQIFTNCGVKETQTAEIISHGRGLILLDGLDEVTEEDASLILNQIQQFTNQYHTNSFVITCRIAAQDYIFENFTEVEVADFDDQQIRTFATKWFKSKQSDSADDFIKQLENNKSIKELATNPLLLTLLCLEFEDSGNFPVDRAELYSRAIHTLLRKWDDKRRIQREQAYKKLSVQRKEDLLSELALTTFERKDYFFKQEDAQRYIADYIRNLPDAKTDPDALLLDSEAVLKSIEAQHGLLVERARGIYSFSHLTFQEYFTARKIVHSIDPPLEKALQNLASHITEKRWREVFILAIGMLSSADDLLRLMKKKIDILLEGDEKLQQFLTWVNQKSMSVEASSKRAAVRAFYFSLSFDQSLSLNLSLSSSLNLFYSFSLSRALNIDLNLDLDLDLDRTLEYSLSLSLDFSLSPNISRALSLNLSFCLSRAFDLSRALFLNLNPELKQSLQQLKEQLPDSKRDQEQLQQWWKVNGKAWAEQLRAVMIKYRNIGHGWQFSQQQKELLQQYYDANKLLVDCLNNDCYVSREVRQKIEDKLLLPLAEI
ncbi:MAG: NACHT domain-containing protein [Symploca sp. SIO3C6]|nr:NACHT domain-containing protein [Symploca sp. SIO3C6]